MTEPSPLSKLILAALKAGFTTEDLDGMHIEQLVELLELNDELDSIE